ncbi:MAG: mechanosensitive ion channel [Gammaproteobacteria bacterium]|nr:mechanosensitive ion channel [Gammaproteobacteria bacterium]MBQ0774964.1 mechanosensitive ion channel [Gammaproteobacteria bacterium]
MDFGTAQPYVDTAFELGLTYIPKLLLALITLIIGFWLIHRFTVGVNKLLSLRDVEATLSKFLVNFVNILFKILLIISVAGMVGIETTSFIAMLGAIGLGVGMALQGSLGNLAGGILILFFKPYRVGDVIEVQGHTGRVREIHIFNTILITYDNQKIIIPNGIISNDSIKNLFSEPTRRIDITFGISYGDDIRHVKQVLRDVIDADARILKEPSYDILVSAHADSAIEITTRTWVESNNFWPVHFALYENVKIAFDQAGITIPFPQRDVHMSQNP